MFSKGGMTLSVLYSLFAAMCFTIEALIVRYLDIKAGVPGDITSFCYLFFEGCIGTTCLCIYSLMGYGFNDFDLNHLFWVISAGVFVTSGLVL